MTATTDTDTAGEAEIPATAGLGVFDGNRPTRPGDLTLETAGMVPIPEDGRYGANWRNFTVWGPDSPPS